MSALIQLETALLAPVCVAHPGARKFLISHHASRITHR
jgi:hypothetical protein